MLANKACCLACLKCQPLQDDWKVKALCSVISVHASHPSLFPFSVVRNSVSDELAFPWK